jgi:ligand-binding SRPBCC domain-containing protein
MVRGAFAHFDHDHYFTAHDGGTMCREVFAYRAPFGPLGIAAERLFLTSYMRRFLSARMGLLKQLAESGGWKQFVTSNDNPDAQG